MVWTDSFYFQDGENGQIKIEHLSDQDVNQDQFQESNSDLILDRTRAEPRNNHNNANNTNTFEEKTTVIRPLPQDIIVSIKDENSRSSTCSLHVYCFHESWILYSLFDIRIYWLEWPHFWRTQLHSLPNRDFCPRIWAR